MGGGDPKQTQMAESAKVNGSLLIFSLAFFTYVLIAAASTTDLKLFMTDSKFTLPVLTVEVSIAWFFVWIPLFIIIFHFNMLLNLKWHLNKLFEFVPMDANEELPFVFNFRLQYLDGRFGKPAIRFGMFIIYIIYPLITLLFTAYEITPLHRYRITVWHGLLIVIDVSVSMFILWPRAIESSVFKRSNYFKRHVGSRLTLFFIVIPFLLLFCPTAFNHTTLLNITVDDILHRNLELKDTILVEKEPGDAIYNAYLLNKKENAKIEALDDYTPHKNVEALIDYVPRKDLDERDFRYADFSRSKFINADLIGAYFREATLKKVSFRGVNLISANFQGADLTNADLRKLELSGVNFQNADLTRANFRGVFSKYPKIKGNFLKYPKIKGYFAKYAKIQDKYLGGVDFQGANLRDANFQNADLRDAISKGNTLTSANFQNADLTRVNFQNADLTDANFQGADLTGANFQNADLTRAKFQGAVLENTDLSFAYLENTKLGCANLSGVVIRGLFFETVQNAFDTKPENWPQLKKQFKENNLVTKRIEDAMSHCKEWSDYTQKHMQNELRNSNNNRRFNFMSSFICKNKYAAKIINTEVRSDNKNIVLVSNMQKTCREFYDKVTEEVSEEKASPPND